MTSVSVISAHPVCPARRVGFRRGAALAAACYGLGLGLALTPGKASALTFTNYTTVNGLGSNSV